MFIYKKMFVFAGLIAFVILGIAAVKPQKSTHDNLKVLPQDISDGALDSIMDNYTVALGMECDFCHVKSKTNPKELDYASDERPEKEITRKMMKMVEKINLDYFEYKMVYKPNELLAVSCITCHRGEPRPEIPDEKKQQ